MAKLIISIKPLAQEANLNYTFDHIHTAPSLGSLQIAIIGLGSRGLSILERIVHLARHVPDRAIQVTIFEPNKAGVGIHDTEQPDYLLLNTIACQISMFPDRVAIGSDDERCGPDFYTWCAERNVRIGDDGLPCANGGRPVESTDFLPRRLIGEYLSWFYDTITAALPANVNIRLHRERAVRLIAKEDGKEYAIFGESGVVEQADKLFVTIGHTGRKQAPLQPCDRRMLRVPYPLPHTLQNIATQAVVGIEGFGLAAMDAIAALTAGRGGRFHRSADGHATYTASGREPRMLLYSRSGLPFRVRPDTSPDRIKHKALFLTSAAIAQLRKNQPGGKIDFDAAILPLLMLEMKAAFYFTHVHMEGGDAWNARLSALRQEMVTAFAAGKIEHVFAQLEAEYGIFVPEEHLLFKVPEGLTGSAYKDWVRQFIENDLNAGSKGLLASPLKAALEIWRDLRDQLRELIDHEGLTPDAHHRFFSTYAALVNRTVAGPQKERHQDLLALIDAGIVAVAPGRKSALHWKPESDTFQLILESETDGIELDWVVSAHVAHSGILDTDSPILADLYKLGLILPVFKAHGMDGVKVDASCRPLHSSGRVVDNIWLLGPAVEGATYYNHYVPSGGAYSRALTDAHRAVSICLELEEVEENVLGVAA
ncbi:MAG TPA: FAD/NAD(P)-binding protein [Noviherbaspirillum sp.]|nr:FAD/NAD(P)-binding protein [Noviherbaspirillum sp.]